MKKIYLPFIALIVSVTSALLAVYVHNIFFSLIPLWAFMLGYFTSWRWGLSVGLLLFTGYTITMSLIHNPPYSSISLKYTLPYDYGFNFAFGGFALLLMSGLAPIVRERGLRHIASKLVIFALVILMGYCGYTSLPRYEYTYYADISSLNMGNIKEIHLPVPSITREPYTEIYKNLYQQGPSRDYSYDLLETENGLMLRMNHLVTEGSISGLNRVRIWFNQEGVSYKTVHLTSKYEAKTISRGDEQVKVFKVPLRIIVSNNADVYIRVTAKIREKTNVNFFNFKAVYFSDILEFQGEVNSGKWLFVNGETIATGRTRITGASGY